MSDQPHEPRPRVVVDCETSGLDLERHEIVEVAWHDLETGATGSFVPPHDVSAVLAEADIAALQVNRYVDRIAGAAQARWEDVTDLWSRLESVTLVGANPRFDAAMLSKLFRRVGKLHHPPMEDQAEPWHHRLWDVEAYAAAVLHLDEVPGLARVCTKLGVEPGDHSAAGDVRATLECLRELEKRAAGAAARPGMLVAAEDRIRQLEADRAPEIRKQARAVAAAWRAFLPRGGTVQDALADSLDALLAAVNRYDIEQVAQVESVRHAS